MYTPITHLHLPVLTVRVGRHLNRIVARRRRPLTFHVRQFNPLAGPGYVPIGTLLPTKCTTLTRVF